MKLSENKGTRVSKLLYVRCKTGDAGSPGGQRDSLLREMQKKLSDFTEGREADVRGVHPGKVMAVSGKVMKVNRK